MKIAEIKFIPGSFEKGFGLHLYYPGFDTLQSITVLDLIPGEMQEDMQTYTEPKSGKILCNWGSNDERVGNINDVNDATFDDFYRMDSVIRQVLRSIMKNQYPEEHMEDFKQYAKTLLELYEMTEDEFIETHYKFLRKQLEYRNVSSVFDL